ncbi:hypothetical protein ACIG47_02935 [Promicromonospora sp. NPDC052451]|uniref:hypothetical protein n=1 Tax=Promicromonospora sp. NPDC052451 TaxID=3364407 RepID=UPI0037CB2381
MTRDRLGAGSGRGPMNWCDLFSFHDGPTTHVFVPAEPDLARAVHDVVRMALRDPDLLRGLSRIAPLVPEEKRQGQLEWELIGQFIGRILNRADAVHAETDQELFAIYRQIEQARFAPRLTGDVIIPLVAVSFDTTEPIHVDGETWIEPLTEADHRSRSMNWIRHDGVSAWVAAAATHAVVTRGVTFANQVHPLGVGSQGGLPPEFQYSMAHAVAEATYIVAGSVTGHAQVLVRPHGWADDWLHDLPPLWSAWEARAYPESLNERSWLNERTPISGEQTAEVAQVSKALRTAPANVKLAARRCRQNVFRGDVEDMVLDSAIGLEALLGKDRDALTHRMAQRAALILAEDVEPSLTYDVLKQFYGIRSTIAHGGKPKRWTLKVGDVNLDVAQTGTFFLKMLLRNILLAKEPWTAESVDELMLERFARE